MRLEMLLGDTEMNLSGTFPTHETQVKTDEGVVGNDSVPYCVHLDLNGGVFGVYRLRYNLAQIHTTPLNNIALHFGEPRERARSWSHLVSLSQAVKAGTEDQINPSGVPLVRSLLPASRLHYQ